MLFSKKNKKDNSLHEIDNNNYFLVFYCIVRNGVTIYDRYITKTEEPYINMEQHEKDLINMAEKKYGDIKFNLTLSNIIEINKEKYDFISGEKK